MKKKTLSPTEKKKLHLAQLIENTTRRTYGLGHDHEAFGGIYTSHLDTWTFHPWITFLLPDLRAIRQSLKKLPQYFQCRELSIGDTPSMAIVVNPELHPYIGLDSTGEGRVLTPGNYSIEGIPGAIGAMDEAPSRERHSGPRLYGPERE